MRSQSRSVASRLCRHCVSQAAASERRTATWSFSLEALLEPLALGDELLLPTTPLLERERGGRTAPFPEQPLDVGDARRGLAQRDLGAGERVADPRVRDARLFEVAALLARERGEGGQTAFGAFAHRGAPASERIVASADSDSARGW